MSEHNEYYVTYETEENSIECIVANSWANAVTTAINLVEYNGLAQEAIHIFNVKSALPWTPGHGSNTATS